LQEDVRDSLSALKTLLFEHSTLRPGISQLLRNDRKNTLNQICIMVSAER